MLTVEIQSLRVGQQGIKQQ